MKYLAFVMRLSLILSGIYLFFTASAHPSPQCVTGLAIFITGLYLGLQARFGKNFTECLFGMTKTPEKKKGFFN